MSHTWIAKYEKNMAYPDSTVLLKMGKILGVRSEYFFRPEVISLTQVEYRKRSSLPKKRLQAIEHEILDHVERRMELEALFPQSPTPLFAVPAGLPSIVDSIEQVEHVATMLRDEWDLGVDPISEMIDLLEMHGVRVFCIDARNDIKFDGLFAYVADSPIIVVGKYWPGDRQRFTLAHELGHLLLADILSSNIDIEKACNRFAGALLFPDVSIVKSLGKRRSSLEMRELLLLKEKYGLSMAGIICRAFDMGIISADYKTSLNILFVKKGWRKIEPGDQVDSEVSHVFPSLVFHALAEGYIGDSKAAELLDMPVKDFRRYRSMEDTDAVHCQ